MDPSSFAAAFALGQDAASKPDVTPPAIFRLADPAGPSDPPPVAKADIDRLVTTIDKFLTPLDARITGVEQKASQLAADLAAVKARPTAAGPAKSYSLSASNGEVMTGDDFGELWMKVARKNQELAAKPRALPPPQAAVYRAAPAPTVTYYGAAYQPPVTLGTYGAGAGASACSTGSPCASGRGAGLFGFR